MKKGDLIIWDSGSGYFGYEVGIYSNNIGCINNTCEVVLIVDSFEGNFCLPSSEIFPFLAETIDKLNTKYGYNHLVSRRYDNLLERLNNKKLQYENNK